MPTINPQAVRGPVTAIPVVAGTGVRLVEDVPNNRVVAEVDETVLWEGNGTSGTTMNLSETAKNFDRIRIYAHDSNRGRGLIYEQNPANIVNNDTLSFCITMADCEKAADWIGWYYTQLTYGSTAATALTNYGGNQIYMVYSTKAWAKNDGRYLIVDKIVGINRVASA